MHRFIAWFAVSMLMPVPAFGQHHSHSPSEGASRPHAHWHAPASAVRAAAALREGGHVIFLRHAKTEMLAADRYPLDLGECSAQRNLSAAGVAASKEMGEAFKLLGIPVGEVLASPYCRCVETARLAFGRAQGSDELMVRRTEQGWAVDEAGAKLKRLLAIAPRPGTNTVLVAHIFNVQKSLGLVPEEGEAIVFRPDGRGGFGMVGRVTATQWGDLVRDLVVFKMDPRQLDPVHGRHGSEHREHGTRP
jgi:phosphohistidine phosphatase SixA